MTHLKTIERKCNNCQRIYKSDIRNIKRGWGLCCSKSCAASIREKSKPGYNPKRVEFNNLRRELWKERKSTHDLDYDDPGDDEYWQGKDFY